MYYVLCTCSMYYVRTYTRIRIMYVLCMYYACIMYVLCMYYACIMYVLCTYVLCMYYVCIRMHMYVLCSCYTHCVHLFLLSPQLLSLITAANAEIRSWDELITSCGKNHFLSAMYLMQQALLLKELGSDSNEQSSLLSQALTHLKAYTKPSLEQASNEEGALEGGCPPPPTLVWLSDDRMVFTPPDDTFVPTSGEKVCLKHVFVCVCVYTVRVCVSMSVCLSVCLCSNCLTCDVSLPMYVCAGLLVCTVW